MTTRTAPRGWSIRESYSHDLDSYQMACGHYQKMGVYACNDCNLAPLTEWLALREALIEAVECLEGETILRKRDVRAINTAKAILERVDR